METVKNPYFSMMDFDMNPSQEQAAAANKFNKMIASIQFAGEKFNEDGSNTEEYKLFLSQKTQPNEVIMTADQHKKMSRNAEIDEAIEAGYDYDSSEDKLIDPNEQKTNKSKQRNNIAMAYR